MSRQCFIDHFAYALGEDMRSVEEAAADGLTLSTAEALRGAGFERHYRCRAGTSVYTLAQRAVHTIRENLGDVGAIIYSTCLPQCANIGSEAAYRETHDVKHLMEFPASRLQAEFNLTRATVIGLSQQACTGLLGSLRLARLLLGGEPEVGRVLCLTADRFPEGALYEQSYNLISDGAVACVVSNEPAAFRLVACHAITNGAMARASDDETVGSFFNYTHRMIQETLARAELGIADISWMVPQNMNIKAWQILSRLLSFPADRVYHRTLSDIGHLISGDNLVNLKHLDDSGAIRAGERVLLVMAGYGLNWQCTILERT